MGTDCEMGGCSPADICSACFNMKTDGTETDKDCGGKCLPCGEGLNCLRIPSDCETMSCNGGKCNGCSDGKTNGKETDQDCGGPICSRIRRRSAWTASCAWPRAIASTRAASTGSLGLR